MGFKRNRSNRSESDADSNNRSIHSQMQRQQSRTASQSTVPTFRNQAHAEAHYGQEIESAKELHQLQRLEKRYGDRLHGWLEEGIPKKAMGDPHEMAEFRIQRSLEGTETSRDDVPEVVLDVLGSQGQSLDGTIQRALENRMDADFSNVRIHTGAKAANAADAIDAKAFTCGRDIVFSSGAYDPESPEGQHLLAHELAHVKQQTGAAISMMPQEDVELEIDPDPCLERDAKSEATRVMSGEALGIQRLEKTAVHIQRRLRDSDPDVNTDPVAILNAHTVGQLLTQTHTVRQTMIDQYEYQLSVLEDLEEQLQDMIERDADEVSAADAEWLQSEIEAMIVEYDAQQDNLANVENASLQLIAGSFGVIDENVLQDLEHQLQVATGEFQAMQNRWLDIQNSIEAQTELEMA